MKKTIKKAVALKYDKNTQKVPKLLAKGNDNLAQEIIKLAKENDIFIKNDALLVDMLSKLELDEEIPQELYKAVAEIFAFIYKISNEKMPT